MTVLLKSSKKLAELEDKVSISSKVNSLQYVYHTKMTLMNVILRFSNTSNTNLDVIQLNVFRHMWYVALR